MTVDGFSSGFDTLINSYSYTASPEAAPLQDIKVDEFEKSLFLTKAQEEVVLSIYTGRNSSLQSFEETEELRRYLSGLVSEARLKYITNSGGNPIGIEGKNSYFFTLPDGKTADLTEEIKPAVWFITYESVNISGGNCDSHSSLQVIPVTQDEYHRIKKNPFRGANDRRALRLDLADGVVEIVSKFPVTEYYIRYIRKLKPIVLVDLTNEGLDIEGEQEVMSSDVHESLHQRILERAVELAIRSKAGATSQQTRRNNSE